MKKYIKDFERIGRKKKILISAAAALMSAVFAASSFAAVNGPQEPADVGKTGAELNGYTEARWNQLMDHRLDYDEIDDLVHSFNPAIVSAWSNLNDSTRLMYTIADNLRARRRDMQQLKEAAKASGEFAEYGNYKMQELILDKTAESLNTAAEKMSRPVTASNRPLRAAEREVSNAAKRLMISYNGLLQQREIASESLEMYKKLECDAQQKLSLGLSAQRDVTEAKTQRLQAEAQISILDQNAVALKKNLILICGWDENADPVIGPTPLADVSRLETMNPDADLSRAIAKNGGLIDFRHEDHVKSTASWELRANTEAQMNEELLVSLRGLYQNVSAAGAAYEAAHSGLKAAEITRAAADVQYEVGMLSTAQYLGALTQYQSAKTACLTADSDLFQAMESYDWALNGSIAAE